MTGIRHFYRILKSAIFALLVVLSVNSAFAEDCSDGTIDARSDGAGCETVKFSVNVATTSSTNTFQFKISAKGTFYVDCGNNGTLTSGSQTNYPVNGKIVNHTYGTSNITYTCSWSSGTSHTVSFGGVATDYNSTATIAAIGFNTDSTNVNAKKITGIGGDLSSLFPWMTNDAVSGKQPRFYNTFYHAENLSGIPVGLFHDYDNASTYMFYGTFRGCKTLSFGGGNTEQLFHGMSGANYAFAYTFADCTGFSSIPSQLFYNISSNSADHLFSYTFSGCTGLTTLDDYIFNSSAAPYMFDHTFSGCTGLTSVDGVTFGWVNGTANYMFNYTFENCTNLTTLPSSLGYGSAANYMFAGTFSGCSKITSIPNAIFNGISGSATGMFSETFEGCTRLTSIPANLFSGKVAKSYLFNETFKNCTSLTSIPGALFASVGTNSQNSGDYYYLFNGVFEGCTSLTSIPGNLFSGITVGYVNTFASAFKDCTSLTSIPGGLFSDVTSLNNATFAYVFNGCTNLSDYIPPSTFAGLISNNVLTYSDSWGNAFVNTGLRTSCPTGTSQISTSYQCGDTGACWGGKVSCTPNTAITITLDDTGATTHVSPSTIYLAYGQRWFRSANMSSQISGFSSMPTKTGYAFGGFYSEPNGSGIQISDGNGYLLLGEATTFTIVPATVYAYWVCGAGYYLNNNTGACTVCAKGTYKAEGGNGACAVCSGNTYTTTTGSTSCPNSCISGYSITGTSASSHDAESDCKATVTLDKNGGSGTIKGKTGVTNASVTCSQGSACDFGSASTLSQDNYTFTGGWGTSNDCTSTTTSFTNPSGTYYACKTWNGYTITYTHGQGGVGDSVTQNVTYGGTFTTKPANTFSKPHATFSYWISVEESSGYTQPNMSYTYTNARNLTIEAVWTCDTGYTLNDSTGNCDARSIQCSVGQYLKASNATCTTCPAGKYCAGGTFTYNGSDQGITGDVTAGYFCAGGAKTATPTSTSDSITGASCGKCTSDSSTGRKAYSNAGASSCSVCPAVTGTLASRVRGYNGWWSGDIHNKITGCYVSLNDNDDDATFWEVCYYSTTDGGYGGANSRCEPRAPTACAAGKYNTIESTNEWNASAGYATCYGADCMNGKVCTATSAGYYSVEGATTQTVCPANSTSSSGSSSCTCNTGYTLNDSTGNCDARSIQCSVGQYLKASNATCTTCPAGKYCAGGTFTYNGSDQGITGDITAGYFASGGAKVAAPTSSSDCLSGNTCGQCTSDSTTGRKTYSTAGAASCSVCPAVTGSLANRVTSYSGWWRNDVHDKVTGCAANFSDTDADATFIVYCYYNTTDGGYGGANSVCQVWHPSACAAGMYDTIESTTEWNWTSSSTYARGQGVDFMNGKVCTPTTAGYYSAEGATTQTVCPANSTSSSGSSSCTCNTGHSTTGKKAGATTTTTTACSPINDYSITYSLNSGANYSGAPTSYTYGTGATINGTPTRSGYIFKGWTGSNGSTPQTSVSIGATATGDKTYTANWEQAKFTLTTSSTNSFQFRIASAGTFYVDCGNGGSLSQSSSSGSTISGRTITRTGADNITYTCSWGSSATQTVRFAGSATGYNTSWVAPSVAFNITEAGSADTTTDANAAKITGFTGSLGAIFSTVSSPISGTAGQPRFYGTFQAATNLSGSIPSSLFAGVHGAPSGAMFKNTFRGCSSLTGSIPETLFCENTTSPSASNCIYGAPVNNMFAATFSACSGLSGSIPAKLFVGIHGAPAGWMFSSTFSGCSKLTGSIPETLFCQNTTSPSASNCIYGAPADGMFGSTFSACSGLSGSIPAKLFAGISGAPAQYMFNYTFNWCINLTGSIPTALFAGISGAPAYHMFYNTFYQTTKLTGITDGTTTTTYVPSTFLSAITDGTAEEPVTNMFANGGLATSCPAGTYTVTPSRFSDAGKPWCSPCAAGTYTSSAGQSACTVCPADKYAASAGASSCTSCSAGYGISGTTAADHDSASDCKAKTYTITYTHGQGGSGNSVTQNVTYGGTFTTKPANTFSKPHATFSYWISVEESSGYTQPNMSYTYTNARNLTIEAVWTCDTGYTLNDSTGNCDPNQIDIIWDGVTSQEALAANVRQVTYDGDIHTPSESNLVQQEGAHFIGWKFKKS